MLTLFIVVLASIFLPIILMAVFGVEEDNRDGEGRSPLSQVGRIRHFGE